MRLAARFGNSPRSYMEKDSQEKNPKKTNSPRWEQATQEIRVLSAVLALNLSTEIQAYSFCLNLSVKTEQKIKRDPIAFKTVRDTFTKAVREVLRRQAEFVYVIESTEDAKLRPHLHGALLCPSDLAPLLATTLRDRLCPDHAKRFFGANKPIDMQPLQTPSMYVPYVMKSAEFTPYVVGHDSIAVISRALLPKAKEAFERGRWLDLQAFLTRQSAP